MTKAILISLALLFSFNTGCTLSKQSNTAPSIKTCEFDINYCPITEYRIALQPSMIRRETPNCGKEGSPLTHHEVFKTNDYEEVKVFFDCVADWYAERPRRAVSFLCNFERNSKWSGWDICESVDRKGSYKIITDCRVNPDQNSDEGYICKTYKKRHYNSYN